MYVITAIRLRMYGHSTPYASAVSVSGEIRLKCGSVRVGRGQMVPIGFALAASEPFPQWVKETLRADGPALLFGFILVAVGVSAAVLYFFPRKNRDVVVISFGLFTLLYGIG